MCLCHSLYAQTGLLPETVRKTVREGILAGRYQSLVFALVDGEKSEILSFGSLPEHRQPNGETIYEIGSVTKTFTATLLAEAVLSNRLQLDAPIQSLLPDFKIPIRDGRQITLAEIATQRSGLPRMPTDFHDERYPYPPYDRERLRSFLATYKMARVPGSQYEYSNLGFGLLGMALAEHAHVFYGTLLEQEIFRPLGMKTSGTRVDEAMLAHLAPGFDEQGKPAPSWNFGRFDVFEGAGAIRSTASDMLLYLRANMGKGTDELTRAMKLAQTPRSQTEWGDVIGLAWMRQSSNKGDIIWHNGGTAGYAAYMGFTADGHRGVVILSNTASSVTELGFRCLAGDAP